jgi:hypothetical protein
MADTFDSSVMFGGLLGQPDASADQGVTMGGVLGGPRDSLLSPIIGAGALKGARMNALLNLGVGLLANSGYSRIPISTGQALAAGLQGAQQAYGSSLDNSLKGALTAQQLRMQQFGMARQQALLRMAQQFAGGGGAPAAAGMPAPGEAAQGDTGALPGMMPQGGQGGPEQPPPPAAAAAAAAGAPGARASRFGPDALTAFTMMDPEHAAGWQNIYSAQNPELIALPDGTVINPRDPRLAGTNHAALPPGMVRLPDGSVTNAPGFAQSQYMLDANKAAAEHSQDLVPTVIPGVGTVMRPRGSIPGMSSPPMGLSVGPGGQPQLTMGGAPGALTGEDPAALDERKGDVASFLKAKDDAMTKASAATESLPQLDDIDRLIHSVKPQYGSTALYEVGRVLDSAGLLKGDASKWVDNAKQFAQAQRVQVLGGLRQQFASRVSNFEMKAAEASLGNLDDPMQAVLYANDVKRVMAQRQQAKSDFMQNYSGPRGKYEQAWENSPQGKQSLYDYPEMWKHLPVLKGKTGTPAAGQTFVKTPNGTIYPVQVNQYGEPEPAAGAQ